MAARFYLGTHMPHWLWDKAFADVPLFVSRRTLASIKNLGRSLAPWALDSGGFTELSMYGAWKTPMKQYITEVRRIRSEVGKLEWAAPQDWMCEPIITKKTGLTVAEHQRRTVQNFLDLRSAAPELPFAPVLQGWTMADYWRCEEMYDRAGVDLRKEKIVGVGTVCRRQGTAEAEKIMRTLASGGLRLHGFGFKTKGLLRTQDAMASADSLAWSLGARMEPPLPGHDKPGRNRRFGHVRCSNCYVYALLWRKKLLTMLRGGR